VKGKTGKPRHGLRKYYKCRKQFTVKVGTVFECAHIPLHKMLQAVYLLCSSKKGISAHTARSKSSTSRRGSWRTASVRPCIVHIRTGWRAPPTREVEGLWSLSQNWGSRSRLAGGALNIAGPDKDEVWAFDTLGMRFRMCRRSFLQDVSVRSLPLSGSCLSAV